MSVKKKSQAASRKSQGKNKIIFIVGPTAVGKSEVAVNLAKRAGGQIISMDSMQIYKGLDIISSKPPAHLRKQIAHHLIDLMPPVREFNVSLYRKYALKKIKEVISEGKVPVFVGGTGLYMSILIDGIFDLRIKNSGIRRRLYRQLRSEGSIILHKRLREVDPQAAGKIHPNDAKRVIRALEVFEGAGKPISRLQKQRSGLAKDYNISIFGLDMARDALYKKIDKRVEKMFDAGLVNEARRLLKTKLSKTASFAIGIRELKGYFEGQYGLDEAKRLIKRNTRAYAKRQLTWFRKDKRIRWIGVSAKEKPPSVANKIWKELC